VNPFDPAADVTLITGVWPEGKTVVVTVIVISLVRGGKNPESLEDIVTAVPEDTENPAEPVETLVAEGGTTPESTVEEIVAVPLEKVALPEPPADDVEIRADPELAGGTTPESPVPVDVTVLLLVANDAAPEVAETESAIVPLADGTGGIMPEPPVELKTRVLSLVGKDANPEVTVSVTVTILKVRTGGMTPESPVLTAAAVELEIVNANDPAEMIVEFETSWIVRGAMELAAVLIEGVIIPKSPVDSAANVLPEVVKRAEPPIVDGGGITPSLPSKLLATVDPEVDIMLPPVKMTVRASPKNVEDGGIIPASPVEKNVSVPPDTVALPATAVLEGTAVGGMRPSPPVDV